MTKENNEKKGSLALRHEHCFRIAWGYTDIFPFFFKFNWDEPPVPYLFY